MMTRGSTLHLQQQQGNVHPATAASSAPTSIYPRCLFNSVQRLHQLELHEELVVYAELQLTEQRLLQGGGMVASNSSSNSNGCANGSSGGSNEAARLDGDELAFVYFCVANAHFQCGNYAYSARLYEKCLRQLAALQRRAGSSPAVVSSSSTSSLTTPANSTTNYNNRFDADGCSTDEVRFRLHRALALEGRHDEALKCLEAIPRAQAAPKVHYAIAQLYMQLQRPSPNRPPMSVGPRVAHHLRNVVEAVGGESVLHSRGVLEGAGYATGSTTTPVNASWGRAESGEGASDSRKRPPKRLLSEEATAWLESKRLQSEKRWLEAAECLCGGNNSAELRCANPRLALEAARSYRAAGERQKAMAAYQRALAMDSPCPSLGLDALAAFLAQEGSQKELEAVLSRQRLSSTSRSHTSPTPAAPLASMLEPCASGSEVLIAYGYLAQLRKRPKEALQFASRAYQLATPGAQRAEALLLKARLMLEGKRCRDADQILQEALHNDPTHIDSVECWVRTLVAQKRFSDAHRVLRIAAQNLTPEGGGGGRIDGSVEENYQLLYLTAMVQSEEVASGSSGGGGGGGSGESGLSSAVGLLEHVVEQAPSQLDALYLLVQLYGQQHMNERAIQLLERQAQNAPCAEVHRLLGDFLAKANRPEQACTAYRRALSGTSYGSTIAGVGGGGGGGRAASSEAISISNDSHCILTALAALETLPGLATPEHYPAASASFGVGSSGGSSAATLTTPSVGAPAAARAPPMAPAKRRAAAGGGASTSSSSHHHHHPHRQSSPN